MFSRYPDISSSHKAKINNEHNISSSYKTKIKYQIITYYHTVMTIIWFNTHPLLFPFFTGWGFNEYLVHVYFHSVLAIMLWLVVKCFFVSSQTERNRHVILQEMPHKVLWVNASWNWCRNLTYILLFLLFFVVLVT